MRVAVLENDLQRFFYGDQVAGLRPALVLDTLDLLGNNRSTGHGLEAYSQLTHVKSGLSPFFSRGRG